MVFKKLNHWLQHNSQAGEVNMQCDPDTPNASLNSPLQVGKKTLLVYGNPEDKKPFLEAAQASVDLHHPWIQPPITSEEYDAEMQYIDKDRNVSFFVKEKRTRNLVGVINIRCIIWGNFCSGFLGYYAFQGYQGQGLMSEAMQLTLTFAFETMQLHRLEVNVQPKNKSSLRFVKRNGFRREGFSPKYLNILGKWCDHERFAMTAEEYFSDKSR